MQGGGTRSIFDDRDAGLFGGDEEADIFSKPAPAPQKVGVS